MKHSNQLESCINESLNTTAKILKDVGIICPIRVKVKNLQKQGGNKARNWLAQYRSMTHITSVGTVWVNENFVDLVENKEGCRDDWVVIEHLADTFLHEVGHMIAEVLSLFDYKSYMKMLDKFDDEENFAEMFISYCKEGRYSEMYKQFLKKFKKFENSACNG